MRVDLSDGCCRTCGYILEVIDANEATMIVRCLGCKTCYHVEPDAFGEDSVEKYYTAVLVSKLTNK